VGEVKLLSFSSSALLSASAARMHLSLSIYVLELRLRLSLSISALELRLCSSLVDFALELRMWIEVCARTS